jgi:acetyl esterase/lipase
MRPTIFWLWAVCVLLVSGAVSNQAPSEPVVVERKEDVIYGRKFGTALTMDVFTPRRANGAGIVFLVCGGWNSKHDWIEPEYYAELLKRGYTVFAVVHGSQPRFTIPEIQADINRAVRFIRFHAKDYHIDPDRLGITGGSAGGHQALLQGTAGDKGNPKATDPVDRMSSRVQAVACLFPLTDLLNYGAKGKVISRNDKHYPWSPFDFHDYNGTYERVGDDGRRQILRQISPITHVTADSPPTLIIHREKDEAVPLQQSETFIAKLREAGVPAVLIVRKGIGHGWPKFWQKDMPILADWFDKYLPKAKKD